MKELIITAEELYYVGKLLQAKYIDYGYLAAMGDISTKKGIFKSEVKGTLAQKGVLWEDFSGEIEVQDGAKKLLLPIFFGETESSVEIIYAIEDGKKVVHTHRFHFYEGRIVTTYLDSRGIHVTETDDSMIQNWIRLILPPHYEGQHEQKTTAETEIRDASRIICAKRTKVGVSSEAAVYIECNGRMLRELDETTVQFYGKKEFQLEVYHAIKEV